MHEVFKDRKVLITGGLGFIGSNLAFKLVELGAEVTLIDSLIPEYGGNLFNITGIEGQVRVNISDVRDQFSMHYLVQGHDFLFNLADRRATWIL
jgi:UDP-glucose 4-epimerase